MKKFKWISLVLALVLVLASCGSGNGSTEESKKTTETATEDTAKDTAEETADDAEKDTTKDSDVVVYTSFYPPQYMTERIAGDALEVRNMMPADTEVHHWEPTAKDMTGLSDADLLIVNGLGLEGWLDDVKSNVDIEIADTSEGVDVIHLDEHHDHEEGEEHAEEEHGEEGHHHHHGEFDPHIWLAPKNAIIQAQNIKNALTDLMPEEKDTFETNCDALVKELEDLDKAYTDGITADDGHVIVPHEAFGYLARDYGFNQVPIEGITSEGEPDLQKMTELTDLAKEHGITTVFYEAGGSKKAAEAIAKEIGGTVEPISTIEGMTKEQMDQGEDYMSLMKDNMEKITEAIK